MCATVLSRRLQVSGWFSASVSQDTSSVATHYNIQENCSLSQVKSSFVHYTRLLRHFDPLIWSNSSPNVFYFKRFIYMKDRMVDAYRLTCSPKGPQQLALSWAKGKGWELRPGLCHERLATLASICRKSGGRSSLSLCLRCGHQISPLL